MGLSFSSALGFPKPGSEAECPGLPRTDAQAGHCAKAMSRWVRRSGIQSTLCQGSLGPRCWLGRPRGKNVLCDFTRPSLTVLQSPLPRLKLLSIFAVGSPAYGGKTLKEREGKMPTQLTLLGRLAEWLCNCLCKGEAKMRDSKPVSGPYLYLRE